MKIAQLIFVSIFFLFKSINAQTIQHDVLAVAGDRFESSTAAITWTVGETIVDAFNETVDLHQGFHHGTLIVTPTGVLDYAWSENISVYPNPTDQVLIVSFPVDLQISSLEIYDVHGSLIYSTSANHESVEINISEWPSAMYLLRVSRNNESILYKIIKCSK